MAHPFRLVRIFKWRILHVVCVKGAGLFESPRAYHSFQYFRVFFSESDRNFTCNSSPVLEGLRPAKPHESLRPQFFRPCKWWFWTVGAASFVDILTHTHPKIASPLLAAEYRLVGEISNSGLPTIRDAIKFGRRFGVDCVG